MADGAYDDIDPPALVRGRRRAGIRRLVAGWLAGMSLAGAMPAALAGTYPERPIRLVVGFPPGGGADFAARRVSQWLAPALGVAVTVDNKPGANGVIAAAEVARAAADGHTLLLGVTATQAIGPALSANLPYDSGRDFTPVTMIGHTPLVLIVNPRLPVKTVLEFVRMVESSSESVPYGSAGTGNITHMAAELFMQSTGVTRLRHIPYKGSSQVITDLIGGHVAAYFDTLPSALPHVQSGQVRALAVTGRERAETLPATPTMEQAGIAGYSATTWFGVLGPARMSVDVVERLYEALRKAAMIPEARTSLTSRGIEPVVNSPARFQAELESELARWREVTRKARLRLD